LFCRRVGNMFLEMREAFSTRKQILTLQVDILLEKKPNLYYSEK
jgi:hypothetical protein